MIRFALALAVLTGGAQAETAWDAFQMRCLDPFESQNGAVFDGLSEQTGAAAAKVFGPTQGGYLLRLGAASDEGKRSCAILDPTGKDADTAFGDWSQAVVAEGHYVEARGGMLASTNWIDPELHVRLRFEGGTAVYEVIETEDGG